MADNLRSTRTGRSCTMVRNPTDEILYDGSGDRATRRPKAEVRPAKPGAIWSVGPIDAECAVRPREHGVQSLELPARARAAAASTRRGSPSSLPRGRYGGN